MAGNACLAATLAWLTPRGGAPGTTGKQAWRKHHQKSLVKFDLEKLGNYGKKEKAWLV